MCPQVCLSSPWDCFLILKIILSSWAIFQIRLRVGNSAYRSTKIPAPCFFFLLDFFMFLFEKCDQMLWHFSSLEKVTLWSFSSLSVFWLYILSWEVRFYFSQIDVPRQLSAVISRYMDYPSRSLPYQFCTCFPVCCQVFRGVKVKTRPACSMGFSI